MCINMYLYIYVYKLYSDTVSEIDIAAIFASLFCRYARDYGLTATIVRVNTKLSNRTE